MKARTLAELAALRLALRERAAAVAAAREPAARPPAEREPIPNERWTFAEAVGPVTRLPPARHAAHGRPRPEPRPRQRQLDEQAALREALSDAVDVESLLLTDDGLAFRRPGVGPDVLTHLRRGRWSIQGQIDLHGLRREQARDALARFVAESTRRGLRCLRVVHGKGLGSPGRASVLKAKVRRWLAQSDAVIAFAQASGPQGGAGALIVLLAGGGR